MTFQNVHELMHLQNYMNTQESKIVSTKLRSNIVQSPNNCDAFPADVYDPNTMFCWGNSGNHWMYRN